MRKLSLLLVALAFLATACSPRLIGATTGDMELHATFNDVKDLGRGSSVMLAGVRVGAVTAIKLDGYSPKVTLSLPSERRIPAGTTAVLTQTSVLGEWIVDLRFPPDPRPEGPWLEDGDQLDTHEEASLEALADKAADVLGAIQAGDIAAIVEAAFIGLGGKGAELNRTVSNLSDFAAVLADHRQDLADIVDNLGRLGQPLGAGSDAVDELMSQLAGASTSLASNRERFVVALETLTRLARSLNEEVVINHTERASELIAQLEPIASALADNRLRLEDLIDGLDLFQNSLHRTIINEVLTLYIWVSALCPLDSDCVPLDGLVAPFITPSGGQEAGGQEE